MDLQKIHIVLLGTALVLSVLLSPALAQQRAFRIAHITTEQLGFTGMPQAIEVPTPEPPATATPLQRYTRGAALTTDTLFFYGPIRPQRLQYAALTTEPLGFTGMPQPIEVPTPEPPATATPLQRYTRGAALTTETLFFYGPIRPQRLQYATLTTETLGFTGMTPPPREKVTIDPAANVQRTGLHTDAARRSLGGASNDPKTSLIGKPQGKKTLGLGGGQKKTRSKKSKSPSQQTPDDCQDFGKCGAFEDGTDTTTDQQSHQPDDTTSAPEGNDDSGDTSTLPSTFGRSE